MERKNLILTIVMLAFFAATGIVLYRHFSGLSVGSNAITDVLGSETGVDSDEILTQQAQSLREDFTTAIQKIRDDGALDQFANSQQFRELTIDTIKPIIIDPNRRANPFIPPVR